MTRLSVALLVTFLPAVARAAFSVGEIQIIDGQRILTTAELTPSQGSGGGYFNAARCQCKTPLVVKLRSITADTSASNFVTVVAGAGSCLDTYNAIRSDCRVLLDQRVIRDFTGVEYPIPVTANDLMSGSCSDLEQQAYSVFIYTSDPADQRKWVESKKLTFTVDTKAPAQPRPTRVEAGDTQAAVVFDSPNSTTASDAGTTTRDPTIKGYQVLCALASGSPAFSSPPAEPAYETAKNLCGAVPSDGGVRDGRIDGTAKDSTPPDTRRPDTTVAPRDAGAEGPPREAGAVDARRTEGPTDAKASDSSGIPSGVDSLDKAYVCSSLQSSAGTIVVGNLTNGVGYLFYVVTIDNFGNPSKPEKVGDVATPQPEEDLWMRYRRSGGQAEGGYCFVATAAFGSYNHPHVRILREFRDEVLLGSRVGEIFVIGYYEAGRSPAAWLSRHDRVRPFVRAALWPVTIGAAAYLYTTAGQKLLLLGAAASLFCLWRRRRVRGGGR
jgi:hypothetical protein